MTDYTDVTIVLDGHLRVEARSFSDAAGMSDDGSK